jgi:sugar lactone lactonase YvrE
VPPTFTGLTPERVLPGARLTLVGRDLPVPETVDGSITIGGVPARVVLATTTRTVVEVPAGLEGGALEVRAAWLPGAALVAQVGRQIAAGLHQVDNPVCDAAGRLYVTYSGSRGQEVPVSIFRITQDGAREPFVSGIANPTSMAIGPDGRVYVSSRFEGAVYRVFDDGRYEVVVSDLGVACGLAFGADGTLFVGDRSGTIFRIEGDRVFRLATLPPSVAAFHLAMGADGRLFVAAPTLAPRDFIYRIDAGGAVEVLDVAFGRPQGLAFDAHGDLHIVEALAGAAGIYRWREGGAPELVVAGPNIVGLTFTSDERMYVATSDAVYGF